MGWLTAGAFDPLFHMPAPALCADAVSRIELGSPTALIGVRFTSVFAVCYGCVDADDLSAGWEVLDPADHIYTKARYSACPTIRWFDGWFYLVTLFDSIPNPRGPHCVRDCDLERGRGRGLPSTCLPPLFSTALWRVERGGAFRVCVIGTFRVCVAWTVY